jgi:hypothetical protein
MSRKPILSPTRKHAHCKSLTLALVISRKNALSSRYSPSMKIKEAEDYSCLSEAKAFALLKEQACCCAVISVFGPARDRTDKPSHLGVLEITGLLAQDPPLPDSWTESITSDTFWLRAAIRVIHLLPADSRKQILPHPQRLSMKWSSDTVIIIMLTTFLSRDVSASQPREQMMARLLYGADMLRRCVLLRSLGSGRHVPRNKRNILEGENRPLSL